jgi:hypothetical protein
MILFYFYLLYLSLFIKTFLIFSLIPQKLNSYICIRLILTLINPSIIVVEFNKKDIAVMN